MSEENGLRNGDLIITIRKEGYDNIRSPMSKVITERSMSIVENPREFLKQNIELLVERYLNG